MLKRGLEGKGVAVIFSDLDGTLLDRDNYSYKHARGALNLVKSKNIPLIFCSAKTRAEQEVYRQMLGLDDPFIVENGGALYIKERYFTFSYSFQKKDDEYKVIEFGTPYSQIRKDLQEVRNQTRTPCRGYGDMGIDEVSRLTGLDREMAQRAKQREYVETVIFDCEEGKRKTFIEKLKQRGYECVFGGRFYSIIKGNDKGKAVSLITQLLQRKFRKVYTIGIGDSFNDVPLLSKVDLPILVQKEIGVWEDINIKNLYRTEGVGPIGWNIAINELFSI